MGYFTLLCFWVLKSVGIVLVGATVAHVLAIGMSAVRMYLRVKKDHVWWDDRLALGGAMMDVVYMMSMWVEALDRE